MKKNKFIKNTFILIFGGFITKILGFIIKILYTRFLKDKGVSYITLVYPTYTLLITISSFALPLAVTKLIAQNKKRKSKIIFSSFWISMLINLIIITLSMLFANYFASNILHQPSCSLLIKILCLTLPFVSTTSIIKAYFFGIENVIPIILSNISEEIIKLIIVILLLPKMILKGTLYGVSFYLFINLICEIISFIILSLFLPRNIRIKKLSYKYDHECALSLTKIAFPTLSGRIIGSLGYFIEPILLTNLLIKKGLSPNYIHLNYGYFQGYAIAILTIPSFFLIALSNNIVPLISKKKSKKEYNEIKKDVRKIIKLIFFYGLIYILILKVYGRQIMYLLYKSTKGYKYLKILLPFFILFYLETPLMSILQGLDQEKKVFKITTLSLIIKYFILIIFIKLNFKFISLIISEIINIIFVILLCIYYLKKCLSYSY